MPLQSDEMILFRNTMRIIDGHLDAFKAAIGEAVDFVEQHGPQLMVQTFIDEDRMRAISYQLYRDSRSILRHWELSDPYIAKVMEHCTVEDFQVHGQPNNTVLEGLRGMMEDGRATLTPRLAGFVRLAMPVRSHESGTRPASGAPVTPQGAAHAAGFSRPMRPGGESCMPGRQNDDKPLAAH